MGASPVMKLNDALKNVSLIAFDTAPIIYFVEANPNYDALVTAIFQKVEDEKIIGITSVISLCEVLVHPIRNQNFTLKQRYFDILQNSPNFVTKSINSSIAGRAAELRSKYNLRTPDALQIATALENGCDSFLCNDNGLKRISEIQILVLDNLEL
ncbi:MAG: type II toxin-antitoxin system VapC family toxin [Pyrinomonadaceae bacterium]